MTESPSHSRSAADLVLFYAVVLGISVVVVSYAVTRAFVWDEGYHLIAAQQISQGKLPYIDFCFPQTPLNAYLNAFIIRVFGQEWRAIHVMAASFSLGAMFLIAHYVLEHFPVSRWRLPCAITVASFIGLNAILVEFGTIGQAYGIALFFTVAAFRLALLSPERVSVLPPFLCGLLACTAAGSTLLTAPIVLVLLFWLWKYDRVGLPWRKAGAFVAGSVLPFLPVVWLYFKGPAQTLFNVAQYHALYRRVAWPGATLHDIRVFTSWLDSTQALTMLALCAAGIYFLTRESDWPHKVRVEFYLAAYIATAEALFLCTPHPTFSRYYIFLTPFVALVAMPGFYYIACKFDLASRPARPAVIATLLMTLMFVKSALESENATTWPEYEEIATRVAQVLPPNGRLFADELVYFALHRNPPSGLELSYSHVLLLPPEQEKLLHIISEPEISRQIKRQEFDVIQSCSDAEMERLGLPGPYKNRFDMDECTIFWRSGAK